MSKKTYIKELTIENFYKYGSFADMLNLPSTNSARGDAPVAFTPDMALLNLGQSTNASFSVTRVKPRENKINFMEFHSFTGEGVMPLDGDIYVHVAPPSHKNMVPMDRIEVFYVPKGTLLTLRMGVWHGAPYAAGPEPVNVLCVLPERTYANDAFFHMVPEEEQIEIINE